MALLLAWLAGWTVLGLLFGHALAAAFIGLAGYLLLYLVYAYRLHRWLANDENDPPEGIGIWQEIFTEFYRLNQRNRKRKKRLKNIVDEFQASTAALPDGAVVLDAQGRIVWFNQAAAAMLALRPQQDRGQRIANLLRHPRFSAYLAAGQFEQREIEVPSPASNEAVVSLRIIPYGNQQRLLIARDVSAQKRIEAMRRDFVANASHELRTPLTVLHGYLEMMQEETGTNSQLARWQRPIREMGDQALRMSRIVESLLRLARVEAEGLQQRQEVVDVPAMITRLVDAAHRAAGKNQGVASELDANVYLYGRRGELESIFSNLIENAVQYSPEGADIKLRWWADEAAVYFAISDTGVGIEAAHIPRLTERFYRVDAARTATTGGTGLGLAIVKHCLDHHEAELAIASEPNVGSEFTCRFPRHRAHLRSAA